MKECVEESDKKRGTRFRRSELETSRERERLNRDPTNGKVQRESPTGKSNGKVRKGSFFRKWQVLLFLVIAYHIRVRYSIWSIGIEQTLKSTEK